MKRREFMALIGGALAVPSVVARAQQLDRVRRLGIMVSGPTETDAEGQARVAALRLGLLERGWVEGHITVGLVLIPAECGSMPPNWWI